MVTMDGDRKSPADTFYLPKAGRKSKNIDVYGPYRFINGGVGTILSLMSH